MRINHNIPALYAYNALSDTNNQLQKAIRNLSTGLRINMAADDAAGLAISEKMRSQIRGLDQALRNSQDGISMIQTAEGALTEVHSILQRIRELTVQAANDTLTATDRSYIQGEIDQLKDEINRIANTTQFNKKLLLSGDASVLWSSDKLSTSVIVRGGGGEKDQFGQKISTEGNYKINITAEPGAAQVQKSNIYEVSRPKLEEVEGIRRNPHDFSGADRININTGQNTSGATSGTGWNFTNGVLTITNDGTYIIEGTNMPTTNQVVVQSGVTAYILLSGVNINTSATPDTCAFDMFGATVDLYLEGNNNLTSGDSRAGLEVRDGSTLNITSMAGDGSPNGTLNASGGFLAAGIGGWGFDLYSLRNGRSGTITIYGGTITAIGDQGGAGIGGGDTGYYGGIGSQDGGGTITINGGIITAIGGGSGGAGIGSGYYADYPNNYPFNPNIISDDGTVITINGGTITAIGGSVVNESGAGIGGGGRSSSGTITINTRANINATAGTSGTPPAEAIGHGAYSNVSDVTYVSTPLTSTVYEDKYNPLSEIIEFYNANGVFTVRDPQTITIYQGDGESTSVTLYGDDTMLDVSKKINDAIAFSLEQSVYVNNTNQFCTISDGTENTSESVYKKVPVYSDTVYNDDGTIKEPSVLIGYKTYATLLVRSAIPGADGELHFSGDEDVLQALGLNTIQQSRESEFTVTVYDAHNGNMINSPQQVSGSVIYGAITDNIDVKFNPLANINVSWNENTKSYNFSQISDPYTTIVHIANNETVLQVGANEQEDLTIRLGNMSASALGLDGILVISRETAARAITRLDAAITKVSKQRALLGAYQNRLEHTVTNLTTASTNTTAAESRIRDADMSKEMLNFTRLQILMQSGTSMLAQANQLPQTVIGLIRG